MQTLNGETVAVDGAHVSEGALGDLYPEELARKERELLEARHSALSLGANDAQMGVAISGGGIRSATFSLGLFQALARVGLLKNIDYIATVSGGGYFGGFLGKLFLCGARGATPAQALQHARDALADNQSAPLKWLRENGRYIAPTGAGDYFSAAAIYLRNWAAIQYVVGITLLTIFLFANTLRSWVWTTPWGVHLEVLVSSATLPVVWASPWLIIPVVVAGFAIVPLAAAYWLTQKHQGTGLQAMRTRPLEPNYPLLALGVVTAAAAAALFAPHWRALDWVPQGPVAQCCFAFVSVVGILACAVYAISGRRARTDPVVVARNRLSHWLGFMLLVFLMLLLFGFVDSFGQTAYAALLASKTGRPVAFTGFLTGILVLLARQFASYLSSDHSSKRKRIRIPMQVVTFVVGGLLGLIVATFWAGVAHAVLWQGQAPHGEPGQQVVDFYAPPVPQVSLSPQNYIVVAPPPAPKQPPTTSVPATMLVTAAFFLALVVSLLTGKTLTFINLSSIQQFYAARLSRAYLGASNARRTGYGAAFAQSGAQAQAPVQTALDVTAPAEGDDVSYQDYRPERYGGPIHLINVTINETISGTSQLEQRDRKGLGMAVGPCGISVARVHHAVWAEQEHAKKRELRPVAPRNGRFAVFGTELAQVESLTLGQWVAVSGAAFTTGLGARTNLGMSLLLGFSNVRIGYWWDSGISPRKRDRSRLPSARTSKLSDWCEPLFSAQTYLSDEFLARFHGPHRSRWYLSDGGHYENTAVYELIRRRLPFIMVSDNGGDERYLFADLANLIRKARIDFNAEVRFLSAAELDTALDERLRKLIGTPAELQRSVSPAPILPDDGGLQGEPYSRCHALLARVYYEGSSDPGSVLMIVKPSLKGDEPLDLIEYHARHPEFPQETTMDQFFDEAQWESYRKLGTHIGEQLFGSIPDLHQWVQRLLKRS